MAGDRTKRFALALAIAAVVWVAPTGAAGSFFGATAGTLGAIPDHVGGCFTTGTPGVRDVAIPVSNMPGLLRSITVGITFSPTHEVLGDLTVTLIAPGGSPSHVIFGRTGATTAAGFGDLSTAAGPYSFGDRFTSPPSGGWWQAATAAATGAPVASGSYRTTALGGAGQVNPAPATAMDPVFRGIPPNGTWTLRFADGCTGGTGSVSAANLIVYSAQSPLDFELDGSTDYVVTRNTGPGGALTWYFDNYFGFSAQVWGLVGDRFVPADYDGDKRDDVGIWRPGATAAFYIRRSTDGSLLAMPFGQTGDDPSVVGDYDGDTIADLAVYRGGQPLGAPSFWHVWRSSNSTLWSRQFGQGGDQPAPGDYNGDGVYDVTVRRDAGGGSAIFYWLNSASQILNTAVWGTPTDLIVPGDYDEDGRTNVAVVRNVAGVWQWYVRGSGGNLALARAFGSAATDRPAQGDYDGDGRTDIAVWRESATPGQCAFYVLTSSSGFTTLVVKQWGLFGDYPVANFNVR
jgi:hypothetical protein